MNEYISKEKLSHIFTVLTVFITILSVFFIFKFINEIKKSAYIGQEFGVQNTITVSGEGEVVAIPDVATFSFTVSDKKSDANEAQRVVTGNMNKILDALKKEDIKDKDVKTISYNIYPQYGYPEIRCITYPCPPRGERTLTGYSVSHSILVKVRDTNKIGDILSLVGEMGADNVSGINFSIDDEDALKAEAREMAIKNSKEKAKKLAKDLDVKLVRIISFFETGREPYYGRGDFALGTEAFGGGSTPTPNIPTGENKVTSNVSITYEIR